MKRLLIASVVLASVLAPGISNAAVNHRVVHHSRNVQAVRDAYGMLNPQPVRHAAAVDCQDPNVITVDECRISSNGQ